MVVSPCCLERGLSSTPLHHQCEGRPPAFQASRATRATNSAVASAACLKGPRGARYSICGCIARPAFPAPSDLRRRNDLANLGRIAPRERRVLFWKLGQRHCEEPLRRSNPAFFAARWIASRSLSSGAHSRDPLARNDGLRSNTARNDGLNTHDTKGALLLTPASRRSSPAAPASAVRPSP